MASLIHTMSISLDGYGAPPDRSSDWTAAGRAAIGLDVQRSAGS